MAKTLLQLVKDCAAQIGLPEPITTATSLQQVQQLKQFANVTGKELMRDYEWPILSKTATLTMSTSVAEYLVRYADVDGIWTCNRIVCDSGWDATNHWRFVGSISEQEWNAWQYGVMTQPIRKIFRSTADDYVEVFPVPTADGDVLKVSFIANEWAYELSGDEGDTIQVKDALVNDNDRYFFDERLMQAGVIWRMLRAKGLSYDEERDNYDRLLQKREAASRPAMTLSLSRSRVSPHFIDWANVPDTGYGQ